MSTTVYTYNDKVLKNVATDKWLKKKESEPVPDYNPLGLPAGTFRLQVNTDSWQGAQTATLVPGTTNVYDVQDFMSTSNWNKSSLVKILGANTEGVTSFYAAFSSCINLTEVALFDTSSVTDFTAIFNSCSNLTSIPNFPTDSATKCNDAFNSTVNVESGALNMYQKLSSRISDYSDYSHCFYGCGSNTTTGAAELAQIPSDWK